MSDQATQGHVRVVAFAGSSDIERDDGTPLAIGLLPADARRLAACWNACEGMDQLALDYAASDKPLKQLIGELAGYLQASNNERDHVRSYLAKALELLAEKLDAAHAGTPVETISHLARRLISVSELFGTVVTIAQQPRLPLAMGNYDTVVSVRQARVRAW